MFQRLLLSALFICTSTFAHATSMPAVDGTHEAQAATAAEDSAPTFALYPAPHVIELFTSQSCAACPPADELLQQFAEDKSFVALSQHVDYWNHLQWQDTYSTADATARQKAYARMLGSNPYTPQMVVDGQDQLVGSNRDDAITALERPELPHSQDLRLDGAQLTLGFKPSLRTVVWLISYQHSAPSVLVKTGENAGKKLITTNPVMAAEMLPTNPEHPGIYTLPIDRLIANPKLRHAIIVQEGEAGLIRAAANLY